MALVLRGGGISVKCNNSHSTLIPPRSLINVGQTHLYFDCLCFAPYCLGPDCTCLCPLCHCPFRYSLCHCPCLHLALCPDRGQRAVALRSSRYLSADYRSKLRPEIYWPD